MQDYLDPTVSAETRKVRNARVGRVHEQEIADLAWLMSEQSGRRVMYGLLAKTGVFQQGVMDPVVTFFNEGKRSVGLAYLAAIQANFPEQFVMMLKEHREEQDA